MHNRNKSQICPTDDYSNHGFNQAVNNIHITVQLMKVYEVYFMGSKFIFKINGRIKHTVLLSLYNYSQEKWNISDSSSTADKVIWLKPSTGIDRQTDRATVKGMDFKRPVRFQLSKTHYFNSSATNTIWGQNNPKQQKSDATFSVVLILKDVMCH